MELKYYYILTVVSLVSGTPHGYGTKGGASAKAESGAVAGAIGGITGLPLSVPPGGGFSGSFSKSSSSSFSSSSASSSSSSSSFSFSGTGQANGCGSGSCKQNGINTDLGNHGPGIVGTGHTYNSAANSAGLSHTDALSASVSHSGPENKLPCHGNGCGSIGTGQSYSGNNVPGSSYDGFVSGPQTFTNVENKIPCSGNGCGTTGAGSSYGSATASGSSHSDNLSGTHSLSDSGNNTPCSGSNCKVNGIESSYDDNNAAVSSHPSIPSGSHTHHNGGNKLPCSGKDCFSVNTPCEGLSCSGSTVDTKCQFGKCSQSTSDNLNIEKHCGSGQCNSTPEKVLTNVENCKSGQCATNYEQTKAPNSYDIPVKSKPNQSLSNSNFDKTSSPSLYHHGSTETGSGINCDYGSCKHSHIDHNSKPLETTGTLNLNQGFHDTKCDTPNCQTYNYDSSASPGDSFAPGVHKPGIYLTTPNIGSACSTPNCNPAQNTVTASKPSSYNVPIQSVFNKPTNDKSPFDNSNLSLDGISSSCASGKCTGHNKPTNVDVTLIKYPTAIQDSPTHYPTGTVACNTPNCAKEAEATQIDNKPVFEHGVSITPCKTANCGSSTSGPNYASHIGAALSPPNYANLPPTLPPYQSNGATFATVPKHPGTPQYFLSHETPPSTVLLTPTCTTRDCAGNAVLKPGFAPPIQPTIPYQQTNIVPSTPFYNTHTDNLSNCNTPNCASSSANHAKLPNYSGGFGSTTTSFLKPNDYSLSHSNVGASSNAGVSTGINTKPNAVQKPNADSSTDQNQPTYSGGFGGPSGLLTPNAVGTQQVVHNQVKPTHSGNPSLPSYSGSFGISTGAVKPHDSHPVNFGTLSDSNRLPTNNVLGTNIQVGAGTTSHIDHKPASTDKELPQYNGGFGGPSGLLKPNEFKVPIKNIIVSKPVTSQQTPSSCSSGNCDNHATAAASGATAQAEAVAYAGGFGGPPGVLQPHDHGKLEHSGLGTNHALGSQFATSQGSDKALGSGTTSGVGSSTDFQAGFGKSNGEIGNPKAGIISTATAHAAAVASATASAGFDGNYNGKTGIHGHEDKPSGGCGGGCDSNGGSHDSSSNLGHAGGLAYSKSGHLNGWNGGQNVAAGASAKSVAGAISDARAFGYGGSAHATASAHASAGFPTKGGYGG
ncbi:hornerin-like isoform X3 [Bombyx mandarina]|uniref:Hornerin-like isoform X1 n=1 Tax=Bombyx mandarina TaxID=7092 RepID=A0A6J2K4V3_BOMMA|nr:hornerin-like isoform X1 [Bombyx mandarina]XP_028036636.1 hornerin-like isoform X2 [Bombyx mandarina]XP_028036646.1 hornerin-like isoform X3 [Bombyx mandarina]